VSEAWPDLAPWLALAGLGVYHGLNPAMGWLFAVALGLQRRSRGVVLGALVPIALGHEAALALAVLLVGALQALAAPDAVRPLAAAGLIGFGAWKFLRPRSHPTYGGMRIGFWELALWSLLMSTAHGAGLMLFPILLGLPAVTGALPLQEAGHTHAEGAPHLHVVGGLTAAALGQDALAVLVHTAAMVATMAAVALLVYERLGLAVLRRAWINLDAVWAAAFVVAGVFTLFT
jgi:hypothetical protein